KSGGVMLFVKKGINAKFVGSYGKRAVCYDVSDGDAMQRIIGVYGGFNRQENNPLENAIDQWSNKNTIIGGDWNKLDMRRNWIDGYKVCGIGPENTWSRNNFKASRIDKIALTNKNMEGVV